MRVRCVCRSCRGWVVQYLLPDGQVRFQEELHYRRTRRPETPYLDEYAEVEDIWPSASCSARRESPREPLRAGNWNPQKSVGKCDWIFTWQFYKIFVGCRKKIKVTEGLDALGRSEKILFNDLNVHIAGVGFKAESTTPHQIGGMRLSKTKGAHKS